MLNDSSSAPSLQLVILRSSQHTGSYWLADLLTSQKLAVFFELDNGCRQQIGRDRGRRFAWEELFVAGCGCMHTDQMQENCENRDERHDAMHCPARAFCAKRCAPAGPAAANLGSCRGVALINPRESACLRSP